MPNWLTTPLVPPSQTIDRMAQPGLNDSPMWARMKGFGSGALEGLRQQTSPLNLAASAATMLPGGAMLRGIGGAGRMGEAASGAIQGLSRVTPEFLDAAPAVRQLMPEADDVTRLYHQAQQAMSRVPTGSARLPSVSLPAEMVTPGAEAGYNAVRAIPTPPTNPQIANTLSRGLQRGKTPFRTLQDEGAFRGPRAAGGFPEGPGGLTDAVRILRERGVVGR